MRKRFLMSLPLVVPLVFVIFFHNAAADEAGFVVMPPVTDPAEVASYWIRIDEAYISDTYALSATLARGESAGFSLVVPEDGSFHIAIEYRFVYNLITRSGITIRLGDDDGSTSWRAPVNAIWMEASKDYPRTRFGHHFLEEQVPVPGYHRDFLRDYTSDDRNPIIFDLPRGLQSFTITSDTQDIVVLNVFLVNIRPLLPMPARGAFGSCRIIVEGENFDIKSESYIVPIALRDPMANPFSNRIREFNAIRMFQTGHKALWHFYVENAGYYRIGLGYIQGDLQGVPLFVDIEINGQLQHTEHNGYPLQFTGRRLIQHIVGGEYAGVWLEAGINTIALRINAAPVSGIIESLRQIIQEMNMAGIELRMLAGANTDMNRTWDMQFYFPEILDYMDGWINDLLTLHDDMGKWTDTPPSGAILLRLAADSLLRLKRQPERIPSRLHEFHEGPGSASQLIGLFINDMEGRGLVIDRLYIFGEGNMPSNHVGWLRRLFYAVDSFFFSFTPEARVPTSLVPSDGYVLNVWSGGGSVLVETVQQLADVWFTPQTGIPVLVSAQGDESKFILATAAGIPPDGAFHIGAHIPYQLALRNALEDLTQFPDFEEFARANINPDTLTSFIHQGRVYGLTDRKDFFVLMYRRDILEQLNLEVPSTWDDVIDMMPVLRRSGMNFYIPLSQEGVKFFPATLPILFQHGVNLYSADGMRTEIDSPQGVAAFRLMTELFSLYGLRQVANFYQSFRSGLVPIGVSNFGAYMMIKTAANEISDSWSIALPPGVMDEYGQIHNQHPVALSASIIATGGQTENMWEFIKWFMSTETQSMYANLLQNRFGPTFMHNTANIHAFAQIPLSYDDRAVILASWENIRQAEEHPARYMLEREISNAWIATVLDGAHYRVALDRAVINVNREISRRLEDFGYVSGGEMVRPFNMYNIWDVFSPGEVGK